MRTLYLVSKRLPRVCMGGSVNRADQNPSTPSAPRVHGWFPVTLRLQGGCSVCPACAWVVPWTGPTTTAHLSLPRVCMGGSMVSDTDFLRGGSAPRVHGWFPSVGQIISFGAVCPACAWVVPGS